MKIDRHIPIPSQPSKEKKELAPVAQMEIGDSLFFPGAKRTSALGRVRVATMLAGLKYNYRSAPENDGTRVWRVS